MSSHERQAAPSLIQQRITLDRARVIAVCTVVAAGIMLALGLILLIVPGRDSSGWPWITLAVFAGWFIIGAARLVLSMRAIREFEAAHGGGAGRQHPV